MRRHYGLLSTVAMHAWFVLRKIMGGKTKSKRNIKNPT